MTKKQRESVAKYLYDISKGKALIAVISNLVQGRWDFFSLIFGILATLGFFIWGYYLEGGFKDE